MTVTTSILAVSYNTDSNAFSASVTDNDVNKVSYLPTEIDLFKNEFFVHVVQIIVSFIGVYVIVFSIFVIAYIYLKCFRKTRNEGEINYHQNDAQYKSLSFSAVGPQNQTQQGQQEQYRSDSTYLTPVFRDRAISGRCHLVEKVDIVQETSFKRQQNRHTPAIESISSPDAGPTNVYIEITQDNIENSSFDGTFHGNENQNI